MSVQPLIWVVQQLLGSLKIRMFGAGGGVVCGGGGGGGRGGAII